MGIAKWRQKKLIDYIIINKRFKSSVTFCRCFPSADVGSDHQLELAGIKIKLRKLDKKETSRKFDVEGLKNERTKHQFQQTIGGKFNVLINFSEDLEEVYSNIKKAYTETAEEVLGYKKKEKNKPWLSQEVLEMCKRRKELKQQKLSGDVDSKEISRKRYNKINKDIHKKCKADKNKWLINECKEIENCRGNPKRIFEKVRKITGKSNPKLSSIRNKQNEVLVENAEIKKRWKEHFQDLYNQADNLNTDVLADLPSNNQDEIFPDFLQEEIAQAIHSLKKDRSPGIDNITSEMIQASGEEGVKIFTNLINKIHELEECPEDWGKAIIVPIHKKSDKSVCNNYRGISLLSIPGKVFTKTLQNRMRKYVEAILGEEQAGFRSNRSTIDQIFTIRQISEKYIEQNKTVYNNFIDFKQAFDSVSQKTLWQTLRHFGLPEKLINLIKNIYDKSMSAVRVDTELTDWFKISVGVRQGCCLSPYLFNTVLEAVMRIALEKDTEIGIKLLGQYVNNLRFADDIDILAESQPDIQKLTDSISETGKKFGLIINEAKTKTMAISKNKEICEIKLNNSNLEQVDQFSYLGSIVSEDGTCVTDITSRIGKAAAVFGNLKTIWKSKDILIKTKVYIYEVLVLPILLYGSECWTLRKQDESKLLVAEMSWLRQILGVSRMQKFRNINIRKQLNQEYNIIQRIRAQRLRWFGHLDRMNANRIVWKSLHSKVQGTRSVGRQRKRWIDNIGEDLQCLQLTFPEAIALRRNRARWRYTVQRYRQFSGRH